MGGARAPSTLPFANQMVSRVGLDRPCGANPGDVYGYSTYDAQHRRAASRADNDCQYLPGYTLAIGNRLTFTNAGQSCFAVVET
jgi:hypothetical protein